jgi:hypothetical protein
MPLQSMGAFCSSTSIMLMYESRSFFIQYPGESVLIRSLDTLNPHRRRAEPLLPPRFAVFLFRHNDQKLPRRFTASSPPPPPPTSSPSAPFLTRLYGLSMHCIRVIAGASTNTLRLPIARAANNRKLKTSSQATRLRRWWTGFAIVEANPRFQSYKTNTLELQLAMAHGKQGQSGPSGPHSAE